MPIIARRILYIRSTITSLDNKSNHHKRSIALNLEISILESIATNINSTLIKISRATTISIINNHAIDRARNRIINMMYALIRRTSIFSEIERLNIFISE